MKYAKSKLTGDEQHFYATQPVGLQFQHRQEISVCANSIKEYLDSLNKQYALIHSEQALKTAIVQNGPCFAGLYKRDGEKFWEGGRIQDYAIVTILGWNEHGFVIYYNDKTYVLPYTRFNLLLEIWTLLV